MYCPPTEGTKQIKDVQFHQCAAKHCILIIGQCANTYLQRQTSKQTRRQQEDRQTEKHTDRQSEGQSTGKGTTNQIYRQADIQKDKQVGRQ